MGTDFYRTLLVISLYGMGHINEVSCPQLSPYSNSTQIQSLFFS